MTKDQALTPEAAAMIVRNLSSLHLRALDAVEHARAEERRLLSELEQAEEDFRVACDRLLEAGGGEALDG